MGAEKTDRPVPWPRRDVPLPAPMTEQARVLQSSGQGKGQCRTPEKGHTEPGSLPGHTGHRGESRAAPGHRGWAVLCQEHLDGPQGPHLGVRGWPHHPLAALLLLHAPRRVSLMNLMYWLVSVLNSL